MNAGRHLADAVPPAGGRGRLRPRCGPGDRPGALRRHGRVGRRDGEPGDRPKPQSKGRQRFARWLDRFGVPGASLLGPLALPTQFTSATLVASGVSVPRLVFWQAAAIVLWTTIATISAMGAIAISGA
jgi:hypothetical protein